MNRRSLIILAIIVALLFLYQGVKPTQKTAIIIDPINEESEFKTRSTNLLSDNGYKVTYISGEKVTVKLLKNLPKNHDIYIFRVHSTCIHNRTWIFSGEKYQTESHTLM